MHFFDASRAGKQHCCIPVEMDKALRKIQVHLRITNRSLNKEIYTAESVNKTYKSFKIHLNVVVYGKGCKRFHGAHQLGRTVIKDRPQFAIAVLRDMHTYVAR
jgi:hypothetical protein